MAYNLGSGISGAAAGATAGSSFGPWGTAIGAGIGALGGFGRKNKSGMSAKQAALLMQYQNQQEERRMKNAHQWEMQDLIKAGLNPALTAAAPTAGAIAGNGGSAGSIGAQMASTLQTGFDNSANRKIQSALGAAGVFNNIRKIENEAGVQEAQIDNIDADTSGKTLNNELVKKYGNKKAKTEVANAILEGEAKRAKTAKLRAETEKVRQNINIDAPQAGQNERYNKFLEDNPKTAAAMNLIDNILERGGKIGSFVTSILGGKAAMSAAKNLGNVTRIDYYNKNGEFTGMREYSKRKK